MAQHRHRLVTTLCSLLLSGCSPWPWQTTSRHNEEMWKGTCPGTHHLTEAQKYFWMKYHDSYAAQPDSQGEDGRITLTKLSYLRSSEPLIPVVIIVSPWLLVSSFSIVAEHLGICLQNMVQGMQAIGKTDFLSIC